MAKKSEGKRPYTKKSAYWDEISKNGRVSPRQDTWGSKESISLASGSDFNRLSLVERGILSSDVKRKFPNLFSGILPTQKNSSSAYSIRDAVILCKLAYSNVAIVNSTIESMVDFSTSPLKVSGGNERGRKVVERWLKRANIAKFAEKWFRELYTTANVPIMRFLADDDRDIPLRYFIMNPYDIVADSGFWGAGSYQKVLSSSEIQRLKSPKDDTDREVLRALPRHIQEQIRDMQAATDVYLPLDPKNFIINFYNKQDYDLFAIPLIWPVILDVEHKLNLKEMDRKLAKTIDKILLVITSGKDGKVNQENLDRIETQVRDAANGVVLVVDDLTDAKFVIPDLQRLLGKEKYEVVNEDIRTGLHNILVGSEKFSNQFVKTKMFLERLEKGRQKFLDDFLMPEVEMVCQAFRVQTPKVEFHKMYLEDVNQRDRNITRLMELGIISPELAFEIMETGLWPDWETIVNDQKKLKDAKEEGYFQGQNSPNQESAGRPPGTEQEQEVDRNTNVLTGNIEKVKEEYDKLEKAANKKAKEVLGKKRLNKAQKEIVAGFVYSVVANSEIDKWQDNLEWCFENKQSLPEDEGRLGKVKAVKERYSLADEYEAALLSHVLS